MGASLPRFTVGDLEILPGRREPARAAPRVAAPDRGLHAVWTPGAVQVQPDILLGARHPRRNMRVGSPELGVKEVWLLVSRRGGPDGRALDTAIDTLFRGLAWSTVTRPRYNPGRP